MLKVSQNILQLVLISEDCILPRNKWFIQTRQLRDHSQVMSVKSRGSFLSEALKQKHSRSRHRQTNEEVGGMRCTLLWHFFSHSFFSIVER